MKTIFEYIKPQFKKLFWGLSIKFIGTSMDLCIPWILAYMIDNIISKKNIKENSLAAYFLNTYLDEMEDN